MHACPKCRSMVARGHVYGALQDAEDAREFGDTGDVKEALDRAYYWMERVSALAE